MNYVVDNWSYDPFVLVVAVVIVLHEVGLHHLRKRSVLLRTRERRRRSLAFYGGLVMLLLAVVSPIDYWADDYFFVHMIEHILIMFFAPILIVIGAPWLPLIHAFPVRVRRVIGRAVLLSRWALPFRAIGRFLSSGIVAILVFNIVMVVWHVPALFDLAERNANVHIWLMHSSFFVSGVFFWLQIIPSYPIKPKLSTVSQIYSIVLTNIVMLIMAMSMSIFTSTSWYSSYNNIPGITLSPFADQQIGAAILWVCGDFWALPALVVIIGRAIRQDGNSSDLIDRMLGRDDSKANAPSIASD